MAMGISPAAALPALFLVYAAVMADAFTCNSTGASCNGLVGYVSPNATTLSHIKTLFAIKNLRSLLGANGLSLSTPSNQTVAANQTIRIPFPCICGNGTGRPKNPPVYKVVSGDGLDHIARDVFSGLVTYQQIQEFNHIKDASVILAGQPLKIPLPCSCDELGGGERFVHYGHMVEPGSTVDGLAQEFGASPEAILRLNGLSDPKDLMANVAIDIPLKACTSMVSNSSLDYPLLVANGTYSFTAANCVRCKCEAANNWTLQCEPSQVNSSLWRVCPSMQCEGSENLSLGNTTSSSCSRTTCAYAGYTNQTILTVLAPESTCPASDDNNNNATKFSCWSWSFILIWIHLMMLLCLHFVQ
ncbi:lysM domain-containing GPI-anchored protein 2 [Diospyros lotus]|uniref:lysM domain-containing GPI-anchored protein 2 n=1 Tax=Diospyros lotus TaxID=55363 RepID=UPI00225501D2|nr:lysM domain-containing GPI-anchored protein 2 [Diospyros lotus]